MLLHYENNRIVVLLHYETPEQWYFALRNTCPHARVAAYSLARVGAAPAFEVVEPKQRAKDSPKGCVVFVQRTAVAGEVPVGFVVCPNTQRERLCSSL
jgi:hypothetical protein